MIRPISYIIVIIISLGFTFLNVMPAYYRVEEKRVFLESLNSASNSTDKIRTIIDQTEKELSKIDPVNLDKFNVFLPETIDEIRFINNLSYIGTLNGIVLEDISIEKGEKSPTSSQGESVKKNLITLPSFPYAGAVGSLDASSREIPSEKKYVTTKVRFSFSAPYKEAIVFFNNLEKSLGLINITALSFSPQEQKSGIKGGSGAISYRYTVELETYSLRPPPTRALPAQAGGRAQEGSSTGEIIPSIK